MSKSAGMSVEIETPNISAYVQKYAGEHEVFLSFNSDWHAAAFQDWLRTYGFERFKKWAKSRAEEYI